MADRDSRSDRSEVERLLSLNSHEERLALLARLFMEQRQKLRTMVFLRLDGRLRARLDSSDILQDAYLEAQKRLENYLEQTPLPFYLWLRKITAQRLVDLQRFHLGMEKRAAQKEVPIDPVGGLNTTSEGLAQALVEHGPTPSEAAARGELQERLAAVLEALQPKDREMLALRHFEHLSAAEAAQVLGIGEEAAQKRYLRALERLREVLSGVAGLDWGL